MEEEFGEGNAVVVLHHGSRYCQYGYADNQVPTYVLPTVVASHRTKLASESELFVGREAEEKEENNFEIRYPIEKGIIHDMDMMERVWQHIFYTDLKVDLSSERLIVTEAPLNVKALRERTMKVMFDKFNASFYFTCCSSKLALYADSVISGILTGVVIDSGHDVTYVVPIFEGYELPHAIKRAPVGGYSVDEKLAYLLFDRGYAFQKRFERALLSDIKQKCCFVSNNIKLQREQEPIKCEYYLPNNKCINIGTASYESCEVLFEEDNSDPYSIHSLNALCIKSIKSCDKGIHGQLYKNILLSGGNTFLKGFSTRLLEEIQSTTSDSVRVRAPANRKYSVWIGASIITSFDSSRDMYVTREEYETAGPKIVHSKCVL